MHSLHGGSILKVYVVSYSRQYRIGLGIYCSRNMTDLSWIVEISLVSDSSILWVLLPHIYINQELTRIVLYVDLSRRFLAATTKVDNVHKLVAHFSALFRKSNENQRDVDKAEAARLKRGLLSGKIVLSSDNSRKLRSFTRQRVPYCPLHLDSRYLWTQNFYQIDGARCKLL